MISIEYEDITGKDYRFLIYFHHCDTPKKS